MTYPQQNPYAYPNGLPPVYGSPQHQPGQPYVMPPVPSAPPAPGPQQQGATLPAVAPPVPGLAQGGSGGAWPKMRNLVDRLIIVEPVRMDETATDKAGKLRPEAYFHLTVVNGGPLRYGDSEDEDKPRPHTHEIDTPCRFTNVNSYSFGFVQAVRDLLAAGEHARVGVVQRGTQGNRPYLITKPSTDVHGNDRPGGDALFAEAMEIWAKIWNAKHGGEPFVSPTPRSLVAAPAQPAPQVSYGAPQVPQQPYPYGGAAQPLAQQSPYMPQGYATPNDGAGVPQGYAFQGYQPPQQPAQPEFAPPVEAWIASLPAEQQEGARAQMRAQAAGAAGPGI